MSKSYFISDVHLGAAFCDRKALEQGFVTLLDRIREEKADQALRQWCQGVFFQRQSRCVGV